MNNTKENFNDQLINKFTSSFSIFFLATSVAFAIADSQTLVGEILQRVSENKGKSRR